MNQDIKIILNSYLNSVTELEQKIAVINELKELLHQHSPFSTQPVDCVTWMKTEEVQGNDYNPNHMDTSGKKLLQRSLIKNGFTQPVVVCHHDEGDIVVDGFHRYLLSQTDTVLQERLKGYIPVSRIGEGKHQDQQERIAATIRHNRARGKHLVTAMSDIVRDLHRLGWRDKRIGEELGMEDDIKQLISVARQSETCKRLMEIPDVRPIIATAATATMGETSAFKSGREFVCMLHRGLEAIIGVLVRDFYRKREERKNNIN